MPGAPAINITYVFRPAPREGKTRRRIHENCQANMSVYGQYRAPQSRKLCTMYVLQGSNAAVRQNRSAINRYRYGNAASSQRIDGRSMQASSGNKKYTEIRNLFCHSLYQTKQIAQFFFWAIILSFLTRGLNLYLILHYTICRHSDSPPDLHRKSSQN